MRSFIALSLAAAASAIDSTTFEFMKYVSEQGKSYPTLEEFNKRMELFSVRDKIIKEWNARPNITSYMGHNFLSDWTDDERKKLNGINYANRQTEHDAPVHKAESNVSFTGETLNWCDTDNKFGVSKCTPIKNQG